MTTAPKSNRPRYHHGNLPEALVQAARELIVERGAEALTLRAVARRVGVTHAAPYRHFRDKSALLAAVSESCHRHLARRMRAARDEEDAALDGLCAAGTTYVRFALTEPALFQLAFSETNGPSPVEEEIAESVYAVDGDGQLPALLWGAWHGIASLAASGHLDPNGGDLTELVNRSSRALVDGPRA